METISSPSAPLGINSSYIFQQPTSYRLSVLGSFFCRGDYVVNNADGQRVMKADHKTWSCKREVLDASGSKCFHLRVDMGSMRGTMYLQDSDKKDIAQLKARYNNLKRYNADLHFNDEHGVQKTVEVRGTDCWGEGYNVQCDGQCVATIERHAYNRESHKEEGINGYFDIQVAANVDAALVIFIAMGIDELLTMYRGVMLANPVSAAIAIPTELARGKKNPGEKGRKIDSGSNVSSAPPSAPA